MFYGLFCAAQRKLARRTPFCGRIFCECGGLITILSSLLFCNGCSGGSVANNGTAVPVSSPTPGLTVSSALPPGTVGSAYNSTIAVSGGTAPYSFSTVSGQLPPGVVLGESTGVVSGTPSASGNFSFGVSVVDTKGVSKDQPLQIAVSNAASAAMAVAVTVTPATLSVQSGGSTQLNAEVSNASNTAVSWSATQGAISSSGLYTAPQVTANTTVTISATSVAEPSVSGTATVAITPVPAASAQSSFSNLQHSGGWGQFGQGPPNFVDCSPSPCDGISFWMAQAVSSPSISGNASEFNVGGWTPYSDALWNNHLIGPGSSQGLPDNNQTLVPALHNFTYDVYFYGDNLGLAQALEFDVSEFFDNMGFIFGHECRLASGNEWDIWDDYHSQWIPTGIPCYPQSNAWNHLTIKVQRTSDNQLTYQSITLNGVTGYTNWTYGHGSAPGWYGLTINYQMDGNDQQDSYNIYLDNLTLSYQ
jgi:hypothetical protein